VRVELLVIGACPNEAPAAALLREALDIAGLRDVPVETVLVATDADAARLSFAGSPSFRVDGRDLFDGEPSGLACRVYPGPDGQRGVPDLTALLHALQATSGGPLQGVPPFRS
jgi:hypothetical protein